MSLHFITEDWKLSSFILQTAEVKERHTITNIADLLNDVTDEWGISPSKLVSVTTDNARNIVGAVHYLGWKHQACFAHTLQLSIKAGLQLHSVSELTHMCRKIVGHFKHSVVAQNALEEKQEALGIRKNKLIQDVATRWNSTYEMLERLIEQERAVSAVLAESTKASDRDLIPSSESIVKMKRITAVLKPFAVATQRLCAEKVPSLSLVQPVLTALLKKHLSPSDLDPGIVTELKNAIATSIRAHFTDESQRMTTYLTSVLDPRYKLLNFVDSHTKQYVFDNLLCRMKEEVELDGHVENPLPSPKRKKTDDILDYYASSSNGSSNGSDTDSPYEANAMEKEVSLFRAEDELDHNMDPLQWWQLNSHRFPHLAKLARRMLSIQATSVPSERLFSAAGNVVTAKRASLSPQTVDMILFLNKNL